MTWTCYKNKHDIKYNKSWLILYMAALRSAIEFLKAYIMYLFSSDEKLWKWRWLLIQ